MLYVTHIKGFSVFLRCVSKRERLTFSDLFLPISQFGKQTDGLGGGTSTTSKIAVVSQSSAPGVDIDYTFVAVPLKGDQLDFTVSRRIVFPPLLSFPALLLTLPSLTSPHRYHRLHATQGNCGNMLSGVGPFAVEEGLVRLPKRDGLISVVIRK